MEIKMMKILPILIYTFFAWWHGSTQINNKDKTIQNTVGRLLKKINKVENIDLRAVFLVGKTTLTEIL